MTTIAYKDGVIAYDSRITNGSLISDDNACKKLVSRGVVFFFTGACADEQAFVDHYHGTKTATGLDVGAMVVDSGRVYIAGFDKDENELWKQEITDRYYATGSGESFAWTAMDLGCSARQAVEMAKKRDTGTGGRVRTHKVKING